MRVLLRRWSLVTDSFTQEMVLKRLFLSDRGKDFMFIVKVSVETEPSSRLFYL